MDVSQPRPQRFFSLQKLGQNGEKESPGLCRSILQSDWLPRFYNLRRPLKTFSRVTRVKSKQNGEPKRKNIDLAFSKKRFEIKEHKFWHKSKKKTFKRCVWYLLMAISKYKLGYYFVQTNTKLLKKEDRETMQGIGWKQVRCNLFKFTPFFRLYVYE